MGATGRLSFLGVLVGLLAALVPAGPSVAADAACPDDGFTERLECWAGRISEGPVVITLKGPLEYEDLDEGHHEAIRRLREDTHPLVVQVSEGVNTGQGGTALLLIAEELLIHPGARIDRLKTRTLADLEASGLCDDTNQLCAKVRPGPGAATLKGSELAAFAADPDDNSFTITEVDGDRNSGSSTSSGGPDGEGDRNRDDKGQDDKGRAVDNRPDTPESEAAGYSGATWTALWMGLLLALLLLAFVIVIRRSRGPVAVGHRAVSSGRPAGGPARAAPAHAARGGGGAGAGGGGAGAGGDESTTRLRVASAPRHGRQVGARPGHARTAVVRTELHPQGYVEVDRVLRRAVWAEPERPPPAPGGLVDVTDAAERDSDVLYAFPPTAARHAKGTPR